MSIPIIFVIIVVISLWFRYEVSKTGKRDSHCSDDFWEKEQLANEVRKKPLDNLNYIIIPVDSLPFFSGIDEKLENLQNEIKHLHEQTIVNLNGISNTDLKLEYGVANLPVLTAYDQNFIRLSRTLYQWGQRLEELSLYKEAIQVLEFGIQCKTDIKGHYILLAKFYLENQNYEKVDVLIQTAHTLITSRKTSIIQELEKMKASTLAYHNAI